jgi:hypothetical protein
MAERVGVSRGTYDRVRYILSNGTEEMIKSLRRGYVEDENMKSKHGPIGISIRGTSLPKAPEQTWFFETRSFSTFDSRARSF